MPNDAYECPKVLLNVDQTDTKIVIESDLSANVCIFALMNASSHYWSPFHARMMRMTFTACSQIN